MKKMSLLIAALILTMLTACGAGQDHGESETGLGQVTSEPVAGAEIEMPEPAAGTDKPEDGTVAGGENAAHTERVYETESIYYSEHQGGLSFR